MDGFLQTKVKSIADKGVTDADLVKPGDMLLEVGEVVKVEIMAGVEAKAAGTGFTSRRSS